MTLDDGEEVLLWYTDIIVAFDSLGVIIKPVVILKFIRSTSHSLARYKHIQLVKSQSVGSNTMALKEEKSSHGYQLNISYKAGGGVAKAE